MKIISLFIVLLFSTLSFSQVQEQENYFQYNIELKAQDTTMKTRQQVAMLRNSKMELYIAPHRSRMDFTLGKISKFFVIIDRKKNVVLSLSDSYAGKRAILAKPEDQSETDGQAKVTTTDEHRTILGYKCTKVIVDDKGNTAIYWVTKAIKVNIEGQQIISKNLPGFPVAFSKISGGVMMNFQLTNVKNKFDKPLDKIFITKVPAGYTLVQPKLK